MSRHIEENQKRIVDVFATQRSKFVGYIARKISGISYMDAEDIVADVLFNLFNKADISCHVENLTAYIYRSLANKIVDYQRKVKLMISIDQIGLEEETPLSERIADPRASIDKTLYQQELTERLYDAIGRLEAKQREVWIATEFEERTFKQLSIDWGEPVGTLLARKSRATKALQVMLKDVFEFN
ncbi:MAG: polymerase, sigma-24 subunit, RpoE, subfamily [Firmicutes bacterium]|nr:polymerase, sigma-24 subunit, RpoE, subfamily [Bacillota bacterium]